MRAFSVTELYERTRAARNSTEALAVQALTVQPRALSGQEKAFARTAWTYFTRHAEAGTGFAPAVAPRPVLSPWEMGATLAAIAAAARLSLVKRPRAQDMIARLLHGLARLPLDRTGSPVAAMIRARWPRSTRVAPRSPTPSAIPHASFSALWPVSLPSHITSRPSRRRSR